MRLCYPPAAVLAVVLALCSGATAAQDLFAVRWDGLRRPSKYGARHPELIVPAEVPGRQALGVLLGPADSTAVVIAEGARRYLDPRVIPRDRGAAWGEMRAFVRLGGNAAPYGEDVGAYDLIAERAAALYGERLAALGLPSRPPQTLEEARAAVAILWKKYLPRLEPRKAPELQRWRGLLALSHAYGLPGRVGFGIVCNVRNGYVFRATWFEGYVPGQGWYVLSAPAGYPLADVDADHVRLITFGYLSAPTVLPADVPDVPAYAEIEAETWLASKVSLMVGDAGTGLFLQILPLYREDDERFVAEADVLLRLAPDNFSLRLFRAVALSRLRRSAEATVALQGLLRERASLSDQDYAHLLWAFAKHLAWEGHKDVALRYVREARQRWGAPGAFNIRTDPDWLALRDAQRAADEAETAAPVR